MFGKKGPFFAQKGLSKTGVQEDYGKELPKFLFDKASAK